MYVCMHVCIYINLLIIWLFKLKKRKIYSSGSRRCVRLPVHSLTQIHSKTSQQVNFTTVSRIPSGTHIFLKNI